MTTEIFLARMRGVYDRALGAKAENEFPVPPLPLFCRRSLADEATTSTSLRHMVVRDFVGDRLRPPPLGIWKYVEWKEPARVETHGAVVDWPVDADLPGLARDWLVASAATVHADPILESLHRPSRAFKFGQGPLPLKEHKLTDSFKDRMWVIPEFGVHNDNMSITDTTSPLVAPPTASTSSVYAYGCSSPAEPATP